MKESPRPEDLGEQRTPVGPEEDGGDEAAVDPRSEPGPRGTLARLPYWFIVGAIIVAAIVFLLVSGAVFPPQ